MKNYLLLLLLTLAFGPAAFGQRPNFSEDIAAILYENCSSCHHSGGIGPFPLMSYRDAYTQRYGIQYAVSNGIMPPWPPDTAFQRYTHERVLSAAEISSIVEWVNNGAPQGDSTLAPDPPVFSDDALLGPPDLKLRIPLYKSKASGFDDYVCFVLPTGLAEGRWLRAIEVIPGDRSIVHHALVFIDSAGNSQSDTIGGDCGGPSGDVQLVTAYVPGARPLVFPNGETVKMGMRVPAGSHIVLNMHYPDGSAGKLDSTRVYLYFYEPGSSGIRQVHAGAVLENWNFCIDANSIDTVTAAFPSSGGVLSGDFSLLSVFPHMHLLGKEISAWATGPAGDSIPFVRIPDWQFDWQDFYFFRKIVKLPSGSRLYARGVYDNTSANPLNPHSPPQKVCAGLGTADEMFLVYFHYLDYRPGDEFLDLDSLMRVPTAVPSPAGNPLSLRLWPNPGHDMLRLEWDMPHAGPVRLALYNLQGRRIALLSDRPWSSGRQHLEWRMSEAALPAGVYLLSGHIAGVPVSRKVVIAR